jgi:hypothetical protein
VRVVTIKHPPVAVDGLTSDSFHLGDVYDVSPHLGIFLTAAGWVRCETRKEARRDSSLPFPAPRDRRELPDRRH